MVMGPSAGLILADLGAEVIKVEPLGGDKTRRLTGSGAGYFPMYNRNKRSISIDLQLAPGREIATRLATAADILIENFRPGAMEKLGLGYADLCEANPGLIYCSAKGFLKGPYEHRVALDEVVQMMGGLAYMTGPPGQPLRAGSSVVDIVGGMFAVIGALSALEVRRRTGRGRHVTSSLFESTVFLVGQHMAQYAVTGEPALPMPVRVPAWAIYDIFETGDGGQVFVGVVSDSQWQKFCAMFGLRELAQDNSLKSNPARVARRDEILRTVRELFLRYRKTELLEKLEAAGLPFSGINRPEDMFTDPHLCAGNGLLEVRIPGGRPATRLPALPLEFDGDRLALRRQAPQAGEHTAEVLREQGYRDSEIQNLFAGRIVAGPAPGAGDASG